MTNELPVDFLGSSRADLIAAGSEVAREFGYQLHLIQNGQPPADFKPFPKVGPGVLYLRRRVPPSQYRLFYLPNVDGTVVVIHFFEKKSTVTENREVALAHKRYRERFPR